MVSAYTSIIFAGVFLAILFLLHFLNRELDPAWRMISEYEIGHFGWMMRLAFFCWGASVLALLVSLWPSLQPIGGTISRWWFVLIVLALFGAGIFKTNPITDRTPNRENTLHTLCGAIVLLTFPIAATLAVTNLLHDPLWSANRGLLIAGIVLVWIGMLTYFTFVIIARVKNPTAGEVGGPHILQGWPNRFMVVTYVIWIILMAMIALQL